MNESVEDTLLAAYKEPLVHELLASYRQAKHNFYLGGHRLSAVEGGRFCEAAYRILESVAWGKHTSVGASLDIEKLASRLVSLPGAHHSKSIRVHIPRALRVVYDIRNNRDAAHLADGIDPNLQDATLVVVILDWVMAELVRLSGGTSPDNARALVEGLVMRKAPVVQDFGDFPKLLNPDLKASDYILVLLYHRGAPGVVYSELLQWVPSSMRRNLRRTLRGLEAKALVHQEDKTAWITYAGENSVERRGLLEPQ